MIPMPTALIQLAALTASVMLDILEADWSAQVSTSVNIICIIMIQVASLTLLTQLLPPLPTRAIWRALGSSLYRAAALPDWVCFSHMHACYSPIVSISATAPRLRPLQLLLPDRVRFTAASTWLRPFQLLLPDCVRFSCCSRSHLKRFQSIEVKVQMSCVRATLV